MARLILFCLAICLNSMAHATCSGPSQFHALPAEEQAELRNAALKIPNSQGLLWRVEKDGIVSYVLGTMHLPHPGHDRTVEVLLPYMAETEHLFLEMTKPDENTFLNALTSDPSLFLITDGPSLIDRLGDNRWETLKPHLQARGLPGFTVARYQPWFLGLTLAIPPCAAAAMLAEEPGLDRLVEQEGLAMGLETSSLDTGEMLLALLASDPLEKQLQDIQIVIDADMLGHANAEALVTLYFEEETELAWEFSLYTARKLADEKGVEGLHEQLTRMEEGLLFSRNEAWVAQLQQSLAETPSTVAVGAAHLPGERGILALLEAAGFSISRIKIDGE